MSSYVGGNPFDAETRQQREKGVDAFLSQDEREQVKRILSFPEEFPPEFGAWLVEYLGTAGVFQQYQVQGLNQYRANVAPQIVTSESTTNTSYVNLATVGPTLTGLADGQYLIQFGCLISISVDNQNGACSPSVNGATAIDADAVVSGISFASLNVANSRSLAVTLNNGGNNTIELKYRSVNGGTVSFANRWLLALRVGN